MMLYLKINNLINEINHQDLFSDNDLYVTIKYGSQIARTTVIHDQQLPVWNQSFLFDIEINENIKLEIYDKDSIGEDRVKSAEIKPHLEEIVNFNTRFLNISMGDIHYSQNNKIHELKVLIDQLRNDNKNIILNKDKEIYKLNNKLSVEEKEQQKLDEQVNILKEENNKLEEINISQKQENTQLNIFYNNQIKKIQDINNDLTKKINLIKKTLS